MNTFKAEPKRGKKKFVSVVNDYAHTVSTMITQTREFQNNNKIRNLFES